MSVLAFFTAVLGLGRHGGLSAQVHEAGCLKPECPYTEVANEKISRCQLQQPITGNESLSHVLKQTQRWIWYLGLWWGCSAKLRHALRVPARSSFRPLERRRHPLTETPRSYLPVELHHETSAIIIASMFSQFANHYAVFVYMKLPVKLRLCPGAGHATLPRSALETRHW